jgi:hypothetical protein
MAYPPEGTGLFRDPLEVLGNVHWLFSIVFFLK